MSSSDISKLSKSITAGGTDVSEFVKGAKDPHKAYRKLKQEADYRSGHQDGYSGDWNSTSYLSVRNTPMTLDAAKALADRELDRMSTGDVVAVPISSERVIKDDRVKVTIQAASAKEVKEKAVKAVESKLRARKGVENFVRAVSTPKMSKPGGRPPVEVSAYDSSGYIMIPLVWGISPGQLPIRRMERMPIYPNKAKAKAAVWQDIADDNEFRPSREGYLLMQVRNGEIIKPTGPAAKLPTWEVEVHVKRVQKGKRLQGYYFYGIARE